MRTSTIVENIASDDLTSIEVGDLVDVDAGEVAFPGVRVLELVDDVNSVAGPPDERDMSFSGPGFIGETDEGQLVFSFKQVVPGSKSKYFFDDSEEFQRSVHESRRPKSGDVSRMTRDRAEEWLADWMSGEIYFRDAKNGPKRAAKKWIDRFPGGRARTFRLHRDVNGKPGNEWLLAAGVDEPTHVLDVYGVGDWIPIEDLGADDPVDR